MRWRLAPTCLLGAWLGATALASAAPASPRATPVVRWQLPLPGWGEPAADDSAAYFLTRTHEVVSVDAATGSIRWRSRDRRRRRRPDGHAGAPCVRPRPRRRRGHRRLRSRIGAAGLAIRGARRRRPRRLSRRGRRRARRRRLADGASVRRRCRVGRGSLDARRSRPGTRRVVFAPVHAGPLIVASFTTFDGPLSGGLVGFDRTGRRRWTHRFGAGAGAAGPPVVARQRRRRRAHRRAHRSGATRVWPTRVGAGSGRVVAGRRGRTRHSRARLARRPARRDVAERSDPRLRRPQSPAALGVRRQPRGRRGLEGPRVRRPALRARTPTAPSSRSICGRGRSAGGPATSRQSFDWPPAASATSIFASAAEALWAFDLHPLETAPRQEHGDDDR